MSDKKSYPHISRGMHPSRIAQITQSLASTEDDDFKRFVLQCLGELAAKVNQQESEVRRRPRF